MRKSLFSFAVAALAVGFSSSLAYADGATAVTINDNPVIDMATRTVTISGTVTCTQDDATDPNDAVSIDLVVKQQWGNTDPNSPGYHFAQASKSAVIAVGKCTGKPQPYEAFLKSTLNDDFKPGTAASVTAFAHENENEGGDATASAAKNVSFHPSH